MPLYLPSFFLSPNVVTDELEDIYLRFLLFLKQHDLELGLVLRFGKGYIFHFRCELEETKDENAIELQKLEIRNVLELACRCYNCKINKPYEIIIATNKIKIK